MNHHSVIIMGHATSLSLEDEFWQALKHIAQKQKISVSKLIQQIDANRNQKNLSSAIRIFILNTLIQEIIQNKQSQ
jgi:predicted DNA-binding ribbon-helix-helix protein